MFGDRIEAHSAGCEVGDEIHPCAVEVMHEVGIDISDQYPKALRTYMGKMAELRPSSRTCSTTASGPRISRITCPPTATARTWASGGSWTPSRDKEVNMKADTNPCSCGACECCAVPCDECGCEYCE